MKAATTPKYGPANVIQVRERSRPQPAADEVIVQVFASPVTAGDMRIRSSDFPGAIGMAAGRLMMGITRPRRAIQGTMFAGRIVEVGAQVTRWAVGDDVFGSVDSGAYAEFVSVNANGAMAAMPASASYAEAADVPYGGVTALRFLRDIIGVEAGDRVLLVGASGGVGRYAIQVAKILGAHVTAVASGVNRARVMELGADAFVDYRVEDWRSNGERYDVVFDLAGVTTHSDARASLRENGCFATLFVTLDVLLSGLKAKMFGGPRAATGVAMGTQEDMKTLASWLDAGRLQATVGESFDLAYTAAAHSKAESIGGATVMVTRWFRSADRPRLTA